MQIDFDRATRARIHLSILDAMPDTRPTGGMPDDNDAAHAYAETVAYAAYPGEVFELARAVDAFTAKELYRADEHSSVGMDADVQYVDVDTCDLRAALDAETVNLALRLCGIRPRQKGRKVRWTDAPGSEPAMPIKLPETLLDDWYTDEHSSVRMNA